MEYRSLGNSDVKVTPLTFGAWAIGGWMWGGADKSDALQAIRKSIDLGITTIDTAPVYGFGLSEEIVGEAISGIRDQVQILTKFGLIWDRQVGQFYFDTHDIEGNPAAVYRYAGKQSVIDECDKSLKRLGTDHIDLLQIHWADPTTPVEETMEAVASLIKLGKIRAAGVCNYSVDDMKRAEKVVALASNQVPYSMLRRDIETDLVPYCLENNKAILPYSPLQRGLLTGKFQEGHAFNDGDTRPATPYYKDANITRTNQFLDSIRPIAQNHNVSLAQLVLRWTLQMPGITTVLAGARNMKQVEENCGAIDFSLSHEEMISINRKLDELYLDLT
ncbi:MAG: aldo/keto reductase [Bacteroidales bacterium]|nr:aldo/keto reductase [Bacteroidales bacterium]